MMGLIQYHLAIPGYQIGHGAFAYKALHHCDVEYSIRFCAPSTNPANILGLDAKEQGELTDPLVHERFAMDQN